MAYLTDELHLKRTKATIIACAASLVLGCFASLSLMQNTPLAIGGKTVFDLLDFLSSEIMLPLGGLFIVIFVGWKLGKVNFYNEISNEGTIKASLKKIIFFIIRYLAPIAIALVFVSGLMH